MSIGGLYHFMDGKYNYATLWLALSSCARSNGVLNAGYICYHAMQQLNEAFSSRNHSCVSPYLKAFVILLYSEFLAFWIMFSFSSIRFIYLFEFYSCQLRKVKILLAGALRSIFIFAPFVSFQAYGYLKLCTGRSVDEMRPWCKARLPLLYNYIQSQYWYVTHISILLILSPFGIIIKSRVGSIIARSTFSQKEIIYIRRISFQCLLHVKFVLNFIPGESAS